MPKLYNLARMSTTTTSTGTITLGSAVSGYLSFVNAGVQNADIVFYGIKDGANSEVGWGTYTSAGTTLTRNVVKSTNANALINLSGSAEVYITALASDGGDLLPGFDHPMRGFGEALNLQINASVASNVLTVAVKGNNGSDASNSNPILIPFRDPTIANGGPVWRAITAALSVNTNAAGAHLGAITLNQAFRLWLVAFDNAGTVVLALWQSVTGGAAPTAVGSLNEGAVASSTGFSASATAPVTFYTPNGTTITNKSYRILGYLDYASGLATPGNYTSVPTTIQLFGPGIDEPGAYGPVTVALTTTSGTTSSATWVALTTGPTLSFTPSSAPNLVRVASSGSLINSAAASHFDQVQIFNSTTSKVVGLGVAQQVTGVNVGVATSMFGLDAPGSASAQSYVIRGQTNTSTITYPAWTSAGNLGHIFEAVEIMV